MQTNTTFITLSRNEIASEKQSAPYIGCHLRGKTHFESLIEAPRKSALYIAPYLEFFFYVESVPELAKNNRVCLKPVLRRNGKSNAFLCCSHHEFTKRKRKVNNLSKKHNLSIVIWKLE